MTEKLKMIYFAKHGSTFPLSGDVSLTCHQDYRIQCLELLILLTLFDLKTMIEAKWLLQPWLKK